MTQETGPTGVYRVQLAEIDRLRAEVERLTGQRDAAKRVVEAAETLARQLQSLPLYERTVAENVLLATLAAWREGKA